MLVIMLWLLIGTALRDAKITNVFIPMIHQKIKAIENSDGVFPVSLDILIQKLDAHNAVKEILNAILYSVDPRWKKNV